MPRRLPLLVFAAGILALSGVIPAAAQVDDAPVLQYERLMATATLKLSEDGRSHITDLVGKVVTVNPAGTVLGERAFRARASEFRATGLPAFPCVYDSGRPGFVAHDPTSVPVDEKNEKGLFRFFPYSRRGETG